MTNKDELVDVLKDIRDLIDRSSIGSLGPRPGILEEGIMRLLDQQSAATEELARIADALEVFVKLAQKQNGVNEKS